MSETVQCPVCLDAEETENPTDWLTWHFLQKHTPWRLARELAQFVYARKVTSDSGR